MSSRPGSWKADRTPIIYSNTASDLSPGRRRLAATMGAHVTIDPRVEEQFEAYARRQGAGRLRGHRCSRDHRLDAADGKILVVP
ncbi:MAG: hypothetical protein NVSMB12_18420 [Acidimicrobiales bacterium]